MASKPSVVFVLGGPGAGKGTQCANIVKTFGFRHLSAGDLLRAERATGSDVAELINNYIKEGKIVPVEITVNLIRKAMEADGGSKFLIDGFPRNENNLNGWTDVMGDKADVKFVLFLECPEETCVARILERGKDSGRVDDNIEALKKRFNTYETETRPIIDRFAAASLVRTIDSTKSPEKVFEDVHAVFVKEGFSAV